MTGLLRWRLLVRVRLAVRHGDGRRRADEIKDKTRKWRALGSQLEIFGGRRRKKSIEVGEKGMGGERKGKNEMRRERRRWAKKAKVPGASRWWWMAAASPCIFARFLSGDDEPGAKLDLQVPTERQWRAEGYQRTDETISNGEIKSRKKAQDTGQDSIDGTIHLNTGLQDP